MAFGLKLCVATSLIVACSGAFAQTAPAPRKRPFDLFPGVIVACLPAKTAPWTVDSCAHLLDYARTMAAQNAIKIAVLDYSPDIANRRFGEVDGFDGDRAIRLLLSFTATGPDKDVGFKLASDFIWTPTAKEVPNVVPGQRIQQNFLLQGSSFYPGNDATTAKPVLDTVLESFFEYGGGK